MHAAHLATGVIRGRRVAVTGIGAVSNAGAGVEALWDALLDVEAPSTTRVGEFDTSHLGSTKELRRLDPFTLYALYAADEAWRQSGLGEGGYEDGASIVTTSISGIASALAHYDVMLDRGASRVSPFLVPMMMTNAASAAVSMRYGLGGPCETVTTACAAGTHAIANAARLVATGRSSVAVAGGAEAAALELVLAGFSNMTALSASGNSRPFDVEHDGFVMGEGAGVLVLEDWEHAVEREAVILAEIVGAASTADAHHITAPDPTAAGAVRCMRLALYDGDVDAREVSYVNAHGTSTPLNDSAEAKALHEVFGDHVPPVTSNKGHLGHALGAAGALEAVASVLSLGHQVIPATAGTTTLDERLGLDVVIGEARHGAVEVVLSNSFGFGGHNGSIVLRRGPQY